MFQSTETQKNGIMTSVAEAVITHIRKLDFRNYFAEPVTEAIAPGYFDVVTSPMCLATMEAKKHIYASAEEICADVDLMLSNCMRYNNRNESASYYGVIIST